MSNMQGFTQTDGFAPRQSGFGLIEILIALVILAIGFLALAALQGAVTRNAADSRARAAATMLAGEKLEELRSFSSSRQDANGDGTPDLIIDLDGDGIGDAVGMSFDQMVSGTDAPTELDGGISGFTYTRNWTVTACLMDADAAVDCTGVTFADADFVRVSVQVVWTSVENAGQTDEVMVHDLISSSSPLDAAVALAEPTRSRESPKVYVTPGRIQQTIPIAIGTDLDCARPDLAEFDHQHASDPLARTSDDSKGYLLTPSRVLASIAGWLTQLRMVSAEGSNSAASSSGVLPERASSTSRCRNSVGYGLR